VSTVAIIQARMGSTRLPGKVLMDLAGEPMLARCVNRTARANRVDKVVVATTCESADDAIERLCCERGWNCFRGSQDDVLDRYFRAALEHGGDTVLRITSDCPLIEPEIIDLACGTYESSRPSADYVSNTIDPRSFPRGLDVEVFSFEALRTAWTKDQNPAWREHVTPYIYRNAREFRIREVRCEADWSNLRWTVDTAEDLEFARRVYEYFGDDLFSWHHVLDLLRARPELALINNHIQQKVAV